MNSGISSLGIGWKTKCSTKKWQKRYARGAPSPPSLVTYIYNRIVRILTLIDNIGFSPDIFPFLQGFFNEHLLPRYDISEQWDTRCLSRGGGGGCLQGNLWYSPPASMMSGLASVNFKMASKVEETDKNFDSISSPLPQGSHEIA